MVANDAKMMEHLKDAKSALNSHTSLLPQILCAEFFKHGYYEEHHTMICALYRQRRDTMMECLEKYFLKGTKYTYPDGGLFTWSQLPGDVDTALLLKEAIVRPDVKVNYIAGEKSFVDGEPVRNCMRLSFGAVPPEKIQLATECLGKFLCEKCR